MKKGLLRILLFTFLSILLLTTASAEETTHFIPEFDLDITIPSEYYTITQDTPADAPIFELIGKTKEEITKISEANHIYFDAVIPNTKEEISVTIIEGNHDDINTDTGLKDWTSNLYNLFDSYGHKVSYYEVYQHPQTRFLKIFLTESTGDHCLMYLTVRDGTEFLFTFSSKEPLTAAQEGLMERVVNSILFDASQNRQKAIDVAEPTVYTDPDTGITFTAPVGWVQQSFLGDVEYLDIQFSSLQYPDTLISYFSADSWAEMTAEEQRGHTREDLDQDFFSEADIVQFFGITEDDVSLVEYNGIRYYQVTMRYDVDVYGVNIPTMLTQVFHIEDGWMYTFQFIGTPEDAGYEDFESLLNSVVYPFSVKTEPSLYTDPDSGVTFTVPVDWVMDAAEEDLSFVPFVSTKYPESFISYWCINLSEEQAGDEQSEYGQDDLNNDQVTRADVAYICSVAEEEISLVRYGKTEYFHIKKEIGDQTDLYTNTKLICFKNDWMHVFAFDGIENDPGYADFEKLLNSVEYPAPSNSDNATGSYKTLAVVLAVIVLLGTVGFVIGLTKENRKTSEKPSAAGICENCGHSLSGDSLFCHHCGARVGRKDSV